MGRGWEEGLKLLFVFFPEPNSLFFERFLLTPQWSVIGGPGASHRRRGGENVSRGVGTVSEQTGREDEESLVIISGEEQQENHGEGEKSAALKAQFCVDRLDRRLEVEAKMLGGAIGGK